MFLCLPAVRHPCFQRRSWDGFGALPAFLSKAVEWYLGPCCRLLILYLLNVLGPCRAPKHTCRDVFGALQRRQNVTVGWFWGPLTMLWGPCGVFPKVRYWNASGVLRGSIIGMFGALQGIFNDASAPKYDWREVLVSSWDALGALRSLSK